MQLLVESRSRLPRVSYLVLCGLALLCAGCGGGGGSTSQIVTTGSSVHGRVIDDTSNQPLSGATVTVGGKSASTNGSGLFGLATSAGTVTITVSANHYHTGTFSAVVSENTPDDVGDLRLTNVDNGPPPPPL
jgi:hypothetical protein